jgi:hypothetical protein
MQVRTGKKHVDARVRGPFQSGPGAANVSFARPSQPRDHRPPDRTGDQTDRIKVVFGSDGEAGFDNVHAELVELARHAQLLVYAHSATG